MKKLVGLAIGSLLISVAGLAHAEGSVFPYTAKLECVPNLKTGVYSTHVTYSSGTPSELDAAPVAPSPTACLDVYSELLALGWYSTAGLQQVIKDGQITYEFANFVFVGVPH
jgi:hypothetical protein